MGKVRTTVRNWARNGLLIAWMWSAGGPQGMGEEVSSDVGARASRLAEIRQRVEEAEGLYRNFEVKLRVRTEYQLPRGVGPLEHLVSKRPASWQFTVRDFRAIHLIRQGECFRVEEIVDGYRGVVKPLHQEMVLGCDGKETEIRSLNLMYENDQAVEYVSYRRSEGESPACHKYFPHLTLMNLADLGEAVPLSVSLKGEEAFLHFYPNPHLMSHISQREEYRVEYGGLEEIRGLKCDRISIRKVSSEPMNPWSSIVVWLAEERNFLPVRLERYTKGDLEQHPNQIAETLEFREVESQKWFPSRCEYTFYRKNESFSEEAAYAYLRRDMNVEEVSLHPHYRSEYFNGLPVPEEVISGRRVFTYLEVLAELKKQEEEQRKVEAARRIVEEQERRRRFLTWIESKLTRMTWEEESAFSFPVMLMVVVGAGGGGWLYCRIRKRTAERKRLDKNTSKKRK